MNCIGLLDHLLEIFVEERKSILQDRTINPQQKLRTFFDQEIELIRRQKEVVIFFIFGSKAQLTRRNSEKNDQNVLEMERGHSAGY